MKADHGSMQSASKKQPGEQKDDFTPTETSRSIIVRLTNDTHRALRIRVAEEDTSIQKWVEALIERELGGA